VSNLFYEILRDLLSALAVFSALVYLYYLFYQNLPLHHMDPDNSWQVRLTVAVHVFILLIVASVGIDLLQALYTFGLFLFVGWINLIFACPWCYNVVVLGVVVVAVIAATGKK
jgi:hypothetical protein